jgi:hypothetical protein
VTVQRRTSSPHPSPAYSDEVASVSDRDDYPTEVFQPFRDDESREHGDYVDPDHWQPNGAESPESAEPAGQPEAAVVDEVHADQGTARVEPEYPTQVIEAYRDEPEHDGSGYQRDGEYAEAGHDGASYDNTGYANTGHENTGYANTGYDNTGHDNTGYENAAYDNAGHDGAGYDGASYDNAGYENTGHENTGHENTGHENTGHENTGHENTGHVSTGYAEQGHADQGYSEQGYSDGQQGYQDAPGAGYATEVAHDGSGYAEGSYQETGHDGVVYDAEGYPEQGDTEQGYADQGYTEQGHTEQGYADQGYTEQGYPEQGHDVAGYQQGGHEHGGYQDAGYAEDGGYPEDGGHGQPAAGYTDDEYTEAEYADGEYTEADYADGDQAQPATPAEPVPVSEQLFGSYHPAEDEYVDTAIIPRITDHGTIVDEDGQPATAEEAPAEGHTAEPGTAEDSGHDTYGHDSYGHDEHGHEQYGQSTNGQSSNGQSSNGQGTNAQGANGRPVIDHADYPTAEQSAAELAAELAADEPTEQGRPGQRADANQNAANQNAADQKNADQHTDPGNEALVAAVPAAGLMAAHGAVANPDSPHAVGPELLAGYSGDEGVRAGRPELDDDGEGRTELIPRYTDDRPGAGKQARPAVLAMALLVVAVVAAGVGFFSWTKAQQADHARPTGDIAFVDRVATAEVKDQVSKAIEAIYSYDSAQLDQSENRALSFITGSYTDEFKGNFATVRQLGPQEKASLVSTVVGAGVESLTESRATLLVMVNQVGHRGDNPQPLRAAVRLNVTAQKVDGQWKVSGVNQK